MNVTTTDNGGVLDALCKIIALAAKFFIDSFRGHI